MKRFFAWVSAHAGQAYIKLFPNTLKKRTWWPIFVVGVVLIAAMSVGIAHAQISFSLDGLLNGLAELIASILIELAKLCIFLTIFFLRAFITLASYNNFIDVSVVKLGWVMVRDVANMFFIVGLLVIAFATILGFESYEWKHGLVKIVLMAILINFSNLIAQLVIDVAHIFTITFLNAVSATAGGNLITLFQMDKILALASGAPDALGQTREVASLTLFAGSVLAFVFALLAALTIGAYLVVMVFRIVMLWALIVLSPLAFMLYAVPKGEDYAHEWWSEFSKHVIVAPIMVFFLWLAFATLGTGQIITEIQKDPNVIQLDSSGEEKQTVTVLEISTWENFASFLLAIGFLWVGIKKTEETGATGAGLVGNAIDFTKNVATIATGYAAGRWLVGGAVEKTKELGGTYTKLGMGALGDTKFGKAAKKYSGYNSLKRSSMNREAALAALERKKEAQKAQIYAEVSRKTGGLAGWLAPSHEKVAKQEAATELAERELHVTEATAKANAAQAQLRAESERIKKVAKEEAHEHGVQHATEQEEKDLTIQAKVELGEHERLEYEAHIDENIKKAQGWNDSDLAESKKIDAEKDDTKRKAMVDDFKNRLNKEGKKEMTPEAIRRAQLQTARDLPHFYARILENQNKDAELALKGREDEVINKANLELVQKERDALANAINNALDEHIAGKAAEMAAKDLVSKKIGKRKVSAADRQKMVTEKQTELVQLASNDKDTFKKEVLDKGYREKALAGISEQQQALIMEKVIEDKSYVADKENHGQKKFLPDRWYKVLGAYATRAAEQKGKKAESETQGISLRTSDILRGSEGKLMDEVRNAQRAKISEAIKEFDQWTQDEVFRKMVELRKTLGDLNKKQTDLEAVGKEFDENDRQLLKNTNQNLSQLFATAEMKGWHGGLMSTLRDVDKSYAGVEDTVENAGKLMLGWLSARKSSELENEKDFVKYEAEWGKRNKEKEDILRRTVQKGVQESAEKHGNVHLYGQMREGMDERGTRKVGLATHMKAGAGSGRQLGSGVSMSLGGDSDQDGLQVVNQEIIDYALPTHKAAGVGDFRALTLISKTEGVDASGNKVQVKQSRMRKEAEGLINAAYTSMNPDDFIAKEGKAKMKGMIGATSYGGTFVDKDGKRQSEIWDNKKQKLGLYDATNGQYKDVHESFQKEWKPVFAEWDRVMGIPGAENSPDKIRTLNRWRRLYQSWDIPGAETMDEIQLRAIAANSHLL